MVYAIYDHKTMPLVWAIEITKRPAERTVQVCHQRTIVCAMNE